VGNMNDATVTQLKFSPGDKLGAPSQSKWGSCCEGQKPSKRVWNRESQSDGKRESIKITFVLIQGVYWGGGHGASGGSKRPKIIGGKPRK